MEIIQIPTGNMENLAYIIFRPEDRNAAIIDASWEAEKLISILKKEKLSLKAILLTHGHYDHSNAVPELLKAFPGIPAYLKHEDINLLHKKFPVLEIEDGASVPEFPEIKMISSPGHTAGSVCWLTDQSLFTGDTLFAGCCGRIDFPESVPEKMYDTLNKLANLPENLKIYPGHSYNEPESTLEKEIKNNDYLIAATKLSREEFSSRIMY